MSFLPTTCTLSTFPPFRACLARSRKLPVRRQASRAFLGTSPTTRTRTRMTPACAARSSASGGDGWRGAGKGRSNLNMMLFTPHQPGLHREWSCSWCWALPMGNIGIPPHRCCCPHLHRVFLRGGWTLAPMAHGIVVRRCSE